MDLVSAPSAFINTKISSIKLIKKENFEQKETGCILIIEKHNVFVTACEGFLKVYDLKTYQLMNSKKIHNGFFASIIYLSDKDMLITGGFDCKLHKLKMNWEVIQTADIKSTKDGVRSLFYLLEKNWIISGCDWSVTVFDADTFEIVHRMTDHDEGVSAVLAIPEKNLIISGAFDRNIIVWKMDDCSKLRTIEGNGQYVTTLQYIYSLNAVLSHNLEENCIKLWNVNSWECKYTIPVETDLICIKYVKELDTLFTSNYDGIMRAYSVLNFQEIKNICDSSNEVFQQLEYFPSENLLFAALNKGDYHIYSIK